MSRLTLQITDLGSGIMVQGNDNHFFPDNATLTFPYNSIIVVTDESDMATFRSASNNDVLFSGLIGAIEIDGESVTKENINIKFDAIANQSSGGGGDITGLFASVSYDSDTKHINFYDTDRTLVDYVDATNFIKDGMVSNVEISNGNLVITFNTDAGKEPITIPLTDIFNPNNYYDKTQSDSLFASQTVVNQEVAARIQGDSDLNTALATKADKSDTYTKTQVDTALAAKVSQTEFDTKEEVISNALNDLESTKLDASDAFSGDYNDLTNKPTIPDTSDFVTKAEYNPKEVAIAEALTDLNENKADKTELNGKQDTLTAGTGISIQNNVISAVDGNRKVNNLGGVTNILKITSADYEALATKDNNTLYIITTN